MKTESTQAYDSRHISEAGESRHVATAVTIARQTGERVPGSGLHSDRLGCAETDRRAEKYFAERSVMPAMTPESKPNNIYCEAREGELESYR
jgi:hypothetical protein